jgi:formylglycine-generating enzyme required for sulfatase activity
MSQFVYLSSIPETIAIPAGEFLMGTLPDKPEEVQMTEIPQHRVKLSSFQLGIYPVTIYQFNFVMMLPKVKIDLGSKKQARYSWKSDKLPITSVPWEDAIEFCARLSILTGKNYRLPSEAEWEYACRAGTTTNYSFGDTLPENQANFYLMGRENVLMPVGQFPPNAFGLYDMHGNVWEWCQDNYQNNYNGAPTDGSAWLGNSKYHVLRGGSWLDIPWRCRSAYRGYGADVKFCYDIGFRVVCSSI